MEFRNDHELALGVMAEAASWLAETGRRQSPGEWINGINNSAKAENFYVGLMDGTPAIAAVLQTEPSTNEWSLVDNGDERPALYVSWVAIARTFAGQGLPKHILDFADELAKQKHCDRLRLDTNADESRLMALYEGLGFELVTVIHEDIRTTALYERTVSKDTIEN